MYGNSYVNIDGMNTYTKEFEEFDVDILNIPAYNLTAQRAENGMPIEKMPASQGGISVIRLAPLTTASTILKLEERATVRVTFRVWSKQNPALLNKCASFTMSGEQCKDVDNTDFRDTGTGNPRIWADRVIGTFNLESGEHLFSMKVLDGIFNSDYFKFEVLSYGSYLEEKSYDVSMEAVGDKVIAEAENLYYAEGVAVKETPNGNAYHITSGFESVRLNGSEDVKPFKVNVRSGAVGKARMTLYVAYGGETELDFDSALSIKYGDKTIKTGAKLEKDLGEVIYADKTEHKERYSFGDAYRWNWKKVTAEIDLAAGDNIIEYKPLTSGEIALDKIEFFATEYNGETADADALTVTDCQAILPAEGEDPARVEFENADWSDSVMNYANLTAGQNFFDPPSGEASNITSGKTSIGKMNFKGNKIRFYVYSESNAENGIITFSMATTNTGGLNVDNALEFTLNGAPFTTNAQLNSRNDTYMGWNWTQFTVSGMTFKEGVNTLEITAKTVLHNVDYVEFGRGEIPQKEADHIINGNGKYVSDIRDLDMSGVVPRDTTEGIKIVQPGWAEMEGPDAFWTYTAGTKFTITIKTEAACTIEPVIRIANFDNQRMDYVVKGTFGESTLTPSSEVLSGTKPNILKDCSLGTFDVEAGTHVFYIEFIKKPVPNLDCFKFNVTNYANA